MRSRAIAASLVGLAALAVLGSPRPAPAKSAVYEIQSRCPCAGPAGFVFWTSLVERLACVDAAIADLAARGGWPTRLLARDRAREVKSRCGDPRLQCDGTGARTCPRRMVCDVVDSSCRAGGVPGHCVPRKYRRLACSDPSWPVCGCDGVTYESECRLRAAGTALRHIYACERGCGGPDRVRCPAGQTCWAFLPCDGPHAWGICADQDPGCASPDESTPWCGCDGLDYASLCEAADAGVVVKGIGSCSAD
jgi:hypothetical protein